MVENHSEQSNGPVGLKRRFDLFSAVIWIIVGAVAISQSLKVKLMAEFGPGPGFLPFWLGVGIIILGLVLLAQAALRKGEEELSLPGRTAVIQLILVMAGVFGFALMVETVGFVICVCLLLLFLAGVVERRGWKQSLVIAGSGTLLFWAVFEFALNLRLAPGLLKLL